MVRELLDIKLAIKMIKNDLVKFDISFERALKNYNEEWFNGKLLESDLERIRREFINE